MTDPIPLPRARRPWLGPLLLVTFITVPIVEVWTLVAVGQRIGVAWTIVVLVVEFLLGVWLIRHEGSKARTALNNAFASGKLPAGELLDAMLIMVGGVLVMLPGFFLDIFGLIFLLPFTRPLARGLLGLFIARRAARSGINLDVMRARVERDTVIKGETVPDAPSDTERPTPDDQIVIKGEIEP